VFPVFTEQDGQNAFSRIERLVALGPRDSGTAGAAYAAQWIAQELRQIGLVPVADTWQEETAQGLKTFINVYAEIPGSEDGLIIIGSHFDTKSGISPDFIGANDGGSSTGLALELARVLKDAALKHTIRFAFFDGEECVENYRINDGLHGSRRMAEQVATTRPKSLPVPVVIVLDMVGQKNLRLIIPRNVTPKLALLALKSAEAIGYTPLKIAAGSILDDHWSFLEQGMPSLLLIDFDYGDVPGKNNYWHTVHDTLDKLSPESLTITGRITLGMIQRLEQEPLDNTPR